MRDQFRLTRAAAAAAAAALMAAAVVAPGAAGAADLFVNGDMGRFGGPPTHLPGIPDGWYPAEPGSSYAQSFENSPFTGKYADNGSSWLRTDDATTGTDGYRQNFSAAKLSVINVGFDFKLSALTNNPWGVQYDNVGTVSPSTSAVHFRLDTAEGGLANQFAINQNNTPAGFLNVLTLEAERWYHVQARLDDAAATIAGAITPAGGSPVPFNGTMLATRDGFSSVLVRDRVVGPNGDLTVDNFSVVPEPIYLLADANADGRVDVADLGILATNFGAAQPDPAGRPGGDFSADGSVDVTDLGILATYFGQPQPGGLNFEEALAAYPQLAEAVPEPAGLGLLPLGGAGLLARRRRRRL